MDVLSAADESDRRHAVAVVIHNVLGSFDNTLVVAEAEIVVGTKVDDLLALGSNQCRLRRCNDSL